jgi:hypothetical protein
MHTEIIPSKSDEKRGAYIDGDTPFFRQELHGICPEDSLSWLCPGSMP